MAIAEACRNVVCVGAEPIGLTDCLNFGNPERPEIIGAVPRPRSTACATRATPSACRSCRAT